MLIRPDELRVVPRDPDSGVKFLQVEHDLGIWLRSIAPSHSIWAEEVVFFDLQDGSRIARRVDVLTSVPHVAMWGPRAGAFREWAVSALDCWTEREMFLSAREALRHGDVDDLVDALLVVFISCPPTKEISQPWVSLALEFLRHEEPDVRDSAVVGTFFGFWRNPRVQAAIDDILVRDPSEAVRARAAILQKGWS